MSVLNSWTSSLGEDGSFQRKRTAFHDWIRSDGSTPYAPEKDRYHLYVSLACPWAHRTLIMRALKGLEGVIGVTVVDWLLGSGGWNFTDKKEGCTLDPLHNFEYLRQVYMLTDPDYSGNITVPVLFDKKTQRIVNNESSEIIRMLNSEFNALSATAEQAGLDFYPESLRAEIDAVNEWVYPTINNGVYRCGFAVKQEPYDKAFTELFDSLDRVETILASQRYLTGAQMTEADIRLFTTLIRFDAVYVLHFKANLRRIIDYPNMYNYLKEIYQMPGVKATVNFTHIKHHYFESHKGINPHGVVPRGPDLSDLETPFQRPQTFAAPQHKEGAKPTPAPAPSSSHADDAPVCRMPARVKTESGASCALPK